MQKAVAITPFWIFSVSHMILSIAQACVIRTGCPLLCACLIMVNLIDHCPVDRCTVIVKKKEKKKGQTQLLYLREDPVVLTIFRLI